MLLLLCGILFPALHISTDDGDDGGGGDGGGDDNYAHNMLVCTQCVSLKSQNTELVVVMKIWPTMEPYLIFVTGATGIPV